VRGKHLRAECASIICGPYQICVAGAVRTARAPQRQRRQMEEAATGKSVGFATLGELLCSLTADDLQSAHPGVQNWDDSKIMDYTIARFEEERPISVEEYDAAFKAGSAQAYPEEPTKAAACYVLLKKLGKWTMTTKVRQFERTKVSHIDGADEMLSELNPQTGRYAACLMKVDGSEDTYQFIHLSLAEGLFVLSALEDGVDASTAKEMEGPMYTMTRRIGGEQLEAVRQKALAGS